jgi:hypothetical protein
VAFIIEDVCLMFVTTSSLILVPIVSGCFHTFVILILHPLDLDILNSEQQVSYKYGNGS